MKHLLTFIASLGLLAAVTSTSCGGPATPHSSIDEAEVAIRNGHYNVAQQLCDSLMSPKAQASLSVHDLCRLTLVFMRLSENTANEEANTAMAARSLQTAISRDADSTLYYLNSVPVEDLARVALITAISEAHNTPVLTDSIIEEYAE